MIYSKGTLENFALCLFTGIDARRAQVFSAGLHLINYCRAKAIVLYVLFFNVIEYYENWRSGELELYNA